MTTTPTALEHPHSALRAPARRRPLLARLVRGREEDATWVRPALLTLLAITAVLYLWDLGASGWANSFYSAAVQAGSTSWKAFFFGSFDSSNFITVDKPPVALWVMDIPARIFGVNSWSILVPEALAGVATVGLVYATVRRWFSPGAALIAGAVTALTPVAALMFRFNNPDAVLVLLLTAAAYATVRAVEAGRTRWLVLAAALVGTGFLTKMMQAYLVVPALALVFLVAAPTSLRRRLMSLGAAAVALVVSSGWWVAAVQLVPAADRPYIGGSQDNSILNLIFGYNGFGRITGNETGSVGGGGVAGSMWGPTGWDRMFINAFGGQVSWLIPAALLLLFAGLAMTWRRRRTDRARAAVLLWGGWLVVTAAVFSFATGIIHPYYTVALAPAIGALVGMGVTMLWQRRAQLPWRIVLAAACAVTAVWSYVLLDRSSDWYPALRGMVLVAGVGAALGLLALSQLGRRTVLLVVAAAMFAGIAGPAAYTLDTVFAAHAGAIPSAGPAVAGGGGGPGGGFPGGPGGPGGFAPPGAGRFAGGPPPGFAGGPPPGFARGGGLPGGGGNPAGGLLDASTPSSALVSLLQQDAGSYTWVAATVGADSAAGYQLATGEPVMAIGGFNGTDPWPTLAAFEQLVEQHQVHWFIAGGGGLGGRPGGGTSDVSSQIAQWVESNYTTTTVGGVSVYDLSR